MVDPLEEVQQNIEEALQQQQQQQQQGGAAAEEPEGDAEQPEGEISCCLCLVFSTSAQVSSSRLN